MRASGLLGLPLNKPHFARCLRDHAAALYIGLGISGNNEKYLPVQLIPPGGSDHFLAVLEEHPDLAAQNRFTGHLFYSYTIHRSFVQCILGINKGFFPESRCCPSPCAANLNLLKNSWHVSESYDTKNQFSRRLFHTALLSDTSGKVRLGNDRDARQEHEYPGSSGDRHF